MAEKTQHGLVKKWLIFLPPNWRVVVYKKKAAIQLAVKEQLK
jgi:hypothetical protein